MTGPRSCPSCEKLFIFGGFTALRPDAVQGNRVTLGPLSLNPSAPILLYRGGSSPFPIGRCPHCDVPLTSDAFPAAGELIPYNAPMLESEPTVVQEGELLAEPPMGTKMSQDDVARYMQG